MTTMTTMPLDNCILQIDDHVKVIRGGSSSNKPTLEGIVAYLGPVKFGDRSNDWVGIRLTGKSIGLGKNDGYVDGHLYFRCSKKCGIFVRKNKVKKKKSRCGCSKHNNNKQEKSKVNINNNAENVTTDTNDTTTTAAITQNNNDNHDNNNETTIRLLQWNILADGLGTDGFLSTEFAPIRESTSDKAKSYNPAKFMDMIRTAKAEDIENGMIAKMEQLKCFQKEKKKKDTKELEEEISTNSSLYRLKRQFAASPELQFTENEILSWEKRYKRMKDIILQANPDILTLQEIDHVQQFCNDPEFSAIYTSHFDNNNCTAGKSAEDRNITVESLKYYYNPANYYHNDSNQKKDDDKEEPKRDDDLCIANYLNHLLDARVAFAPKSYSNAAKLRRKKDAADSDCNNNTIIDDDGSAIFWKRNKFQPMELGFLKYPSKKNKSEAVVVVTLKEKETSKLINVLTTHLPSGDQESKERERLDVLLPKQGKEWIAKRISYTEKNSKNTSSSSSCWKIDNYENETFDGILSFVEYFIKQNSKRDNNGKLQSNGVNNKNTSLTTTIFALDANSRPEFPLTTPSSYSNQDNKKKNETNAWRSILSSCSDALDSVWIQNKYLHRDGKTASKNKAFPVSVNKMRGPASSQPSKIGEHQCELIDHVFTNATTSRIISKLPTNDNKNDDNNIQLAPKLYESKNGLAELELYPSTVMPSDHLPVLVDITLL